MKCWSRGEVCIVAKACGAVGPLGKNPVAPWPGAGKTKAWDGMTNVGVGGEYK